MSDTTTHKVEPKAAIYYYDIGDYLSREEKLARIRDFGTVRNILLRRITPNEKHDWINQRDGVFDSLIPLGNNKDDGAEGRSFFSYNFWLCYETYTDNLSC